MAGFPTWARLNWLGFLVKNSIYFSQFWAIRKVFSNDFSFTIVRLLLDGRSPFEFHRVGCWPGLVYKTSIYWVGASQHNCLKISFIIPIINSSKTVKNLFSTEMSASKSTFFREDIAPKILLREVSMFFHIYLCNSFIYTQIITNHRLKTFVKY